MLAPAFTFSQAAGTGRSIRASRGILSSEFGCTRTASSGVHATHNLRTLVYVEFHATIPEAIKREKQIKEWKRAWKIELIEGVNPDWRDLYDDINR